MALTKQPLCATPVLLPTPDLHASLNPHHRICCVTIISTCAKETEPQRLAKIHTGTKRTRARSLAAGQEENTHLGEARRRSEGTRTPTRLMAEEGNAMLEAPRGFLTPTVRSPPPPSRLLSPTTLTQARCPSLSVNTVHLLSLQGLPLAVTLVLPPLAASQMPPPQRGLPDHTPKVACPVPRPHLLLARV